MRLHHSNSVDLNPRTSDSSDHAAGPRVAAAAALQRRGLDDDSGAPSRQLYVMPRLQRANSS